jgi:hypothetical protein
MAPRAQEGKTMKWVLAGAVMIAATLPACASFADHGHGARYERSSRDAHRIGFERGFRDGRENGFKDARRHDDFNYRNDRSYRNGDAGYRSSYGPRRLYASGYREGYERGYRRAFSYQWHSRSDDRREDRYAERRRTWRRDYGDWDAEDRRWERNFVR